MYRFSSPRLLDLMLAMLAFGGSAAIIALSDWRGGLFVENGPVEMMQAALLFLAACLFVRAGYRLREWAGLAAVGLAWICVLFLTRETPRCASDFYAFGPCFADGYKTAVFVASALAVVLLVLANPTLRRMRPSVSSFARLRQFLPRLVPLILPVPLIVLGQVGEAVEWNILEETAELTAYVFLTLCALRAAQAGDMLGRDHQLEPDNC
ncbi:hypothetical protein [Aureimonas mangrovi]|uniref:hypothetical protein n=1 Tax=Aureimonas mangrovi TaxID=2758041 RepID=UPI00163DAB29|nr:hypothetical protein [Aureimonas mangrovi]